MDVIMIIYDMLVFRIIISPPLMMSCFEEIIGVSYVVVGIVLLIIIHLFIYERSIILTNLAIHLSLTFCTTII